MQNVILENSLNFCMYSNFQQNIKLKELSTLRTLNVMASVIITILGFVFEFTYHDGYILVTGLFVSMIFTSTYFLSFYSGFYKRHITNITYISVFLMHLWGVYVNYIRAFQIDFLLPITLSTFVFSLIFNKFIKSFLFIFTITTTLLVLMLVKGNWENTYAIALLALYGGAIAADIILKRRNEYHLEIERRESQYISLVENMNDGLIYLDNDFNLTFVNDRFCEITGYANNEVIGKNIFSFSPKDEVNESPEIFYSNLANGITKSSNCEMKRNNGSLISVQMSGALFVDDEKNKTGYRVVFTDITSLKITQEKLRKREEGYRSFIEQSSVGIWRAEYKKPIPINIAIEKQIELLLDTGVIHECNDFMARMYGYDNALALTGRKIKDFYYIENNFDEQKTFELLSGFILNNYCISNAETKEMDKHGNIRYMLNNNIGVIENGLLIRTWGVQTDITDRKKTERELIETNKELDTFFYKASHDLKGPLASIMGIINLARLDNKDDYEKYFDMIERSTQRLDNTLLDLIELARTRKGVSKVSVININELVDEILKSLHHIKGFEKIDFQILINPTISIISDKLLLLSIFQNLIHNAINYCKHNKPWIKIKVDKNYNSINIEVTDNGPGIAELIRSKVFEMFYRGNTDSNGSGLGLFIVKSAVEKLHGKIYFDTVINQGTSFFVTVPNELIEE